MPLPYAREHRTSVMVIDPREFRECMSKEVRVWRWRYLRTVAYVVHFTRGRFEIAEVEPVGRQRRVRKPL